MTLTLELAPDVEADLAAAAKRDGRSREELAAETLRTGLLPVPVLEQPAVTEGQSVLEGLAPWIGLFDTGRPGLAENADEEWGKGLAGSNSALGNARRRKTLLAREQ